MAPSNSSSSSSSSSHKAKPKQQPASLLLQRVLPQLESQWVQAALEMVVAAEVTQQQQLMCLG
jgi:hypothetical protein